MLVIVSLLLSLAGGMPGMALPMLRVVGGGRGIGAAGSSSNRSMEARTDGMPCRYDAEQAGYHHDHHDHLLATSLLPMTHDLRAIVCGTKCQCHASSAGPPCFSKHQVLVPCLTLSFKTSYEHSAGSLLLYV
jgi:hypothetical protein